jgi:putative phosphoesterase
MKIGVISDTHNFLDPRVARLFAGAEHILHAGDIGQPRLVWELEQIAPVTAVLGNTDDPGFDYRPFEVVELAGHKFLVQHIVHPRSLDEATRLRLANAGPDIVVFGHTHKPCCETIGRTLFFNPGYAGKARFGLARSVAMLHCTSKGIRPEYMPL